MIRRLRWSLASSLVRSTCLLYLRSSRLVVSDTVTVKQELTPIFENFRKALDTVSADGDTAVYDALDTARKMLANYRQDLPNLRKRIIIVSDGDDTSSIMQAKDVCKSLYNANVLVDSVQVGTSHNRTLHAMSAATGGYRFFPKTSLGDALSVFVSLIKSPVILLT